MKTIFFQEINFFSIFIMFIFRLVGFKVYFVEISNKLRNKFFIKYIKNLGLEWYNYQTYEYPNSYSDIRMQVDKWASVNAKNLSNLVWNKNLESALSEKQNLRVCLQQRFKGLLEILVEVYAIAKRHSENNKKIYVWLPNNFLSQEIVKNDNKIINLCPRFFTFLNIFFS